MHFYACVFGVLRYSVNMKMKKIEEVAAEVAKVHGLGLQGVALEDALMAAWVKNMWIAYPRFTMCVSHNSADMDTAGELIEAYKNLSK